MMQYHSPGDHKTLSIQQQKTTKKMKPNRSCMNASEWYREGVQLLRNLSAVQQKLWLMHLDSHEELDRVAADKVHALLPTEQHADLLGPAQASSKCLAVTHNLLLAWECAIFDKTYRQWPINHNLKSHN